MALFMLELNSNWPIGVQGDDGAFGARTTRGLVELRIVGVRLLPPVKAPQNPSEDTEDFVYRFGNYNVTMHELYSEKYWKYLDLQSAQNDRLYLKLECTGSIESIILWLCCLYSLFWDIGPFFWAI